MSFIVLPLIRTLKHKLECRSINLMLTCTGSVHNTGLAKNTAMNELLVFKHVKDLTWISLSFKLEECGLKFGVQYSSKKIKYV